MSFMFNPHPYDDMSAINRPEISEESIKSIVAGTRETGRFFSNSIAGYFDSNKNSSSCIIALDGYPSAEWEQTVNLITQNLKPLNIGVKAINIEKAYKAAEILEEEFKDLLPEDREKDPVLLFGKICKDGYDALFDNTRLSGLIARLEAAKNNKHALKEAIIVFGCGSADKRIRQVYDFISFFDVTPKKAILRMKEGLYKNLGDEKARPFKELLRRCYYIDFEAACHLRGELLKEKKLDYYIMSDNPSELKLLTSEALDEIMASLARVPFRCKPVYIEGIWGGHFITRLRNLPDTMKNGAWIFDLIPLEVSILVEAGKFLLEFPYFTFVQKEGVSIMGEECVKKFHGYFPIRFNYDDTYHSSGSMSIQVHPGEAYCREHFGEHGRQDESYYVVATGHGAKTYIGFNEDADTDEFIRKAKKSEVEYTKVDYDKYVNSVPSMPGTQFLLPAGTIHASGRNQLILEIGSLTVGSYTYKLYDYLRADLDGIPRPIHTYHGEKVLETNRRTGWVKENLVPEPKLLRAGEGFAEYLAGEHELVYFSLRRLEFDKLIEDDTNGKFHVLTLVDGEKVLVQSLDHPERCYTQNYLDMVVVPADIGRYVIRNLGNQPVCIHKTLLKDGFYEE